MFTHVKTALEACYLSHFSSYYSTIRGIVCIYKLNVEQNPFYTPEQSLIFYTDLHFLLVLDDNAVARRSIYSFAD
jgi:hypothetical protein